MAKANPTAAATSTAGEADPATDNQLYLKWTERLSTERRKVNKGGYLMEHGEENYKDANAAVDPQARLLTKASGPPNPPALGVAQELFRLGGGAVTPELAAEAERLGLRLEHLGVTIGTVIHGVDLRERLSDEVVATIRQVLLQRKVMFFRGQDITPQQHEDFGRRFGPIDAFPFSDYVHAGEGDDLEHPKIAKITTRAQDLPVTNSWHTDVTYMEKPSLGSILLMRVVPPLGGDTLFADMHTAYLGLPEPIRQKIRGVSAQHDFSGFRRMQKMAGVPEEELQQLDKELGFGDWFHPLVRTHPETKKQTLYVHPGFQHYDGFRVDATGEIWSKEECREILNFLMTQGNRAEYQCRFKWEKNSIAFWDNRACQHYAPADYLGYQRVGHRVTLSGDRPFFDPTDPNEPQGFMKFDQPMRGLPGMIPTSVEKKPTARL